MLWNTEDVIFAPFMLRSNIFFSNVNTEDVFTSSFYIWEKMLLPSINGAKITSSVFQSIYGAKITSSITSSYVIVNILNIFSGYIYTSSSIFEMEHILCLRYILKKKMLLRSKDYVFIIIRLSYIHIFRMPEDLRDRLRPRWTSRRRRGHKRNFSSCVPGQSRASRQPKNDGRI